MVDDSDEELVEEDSFEEEKKLDVVSNQEKFLLCVDPVTKKHFWINMAKNYIQYESLQDSPFKDQIMEKIYMHLKMIYLLTNVNKFGWNYKQGEADQYWKWKFPYYLLAKEASDFPSYEF